MPVGVSAYVPLATKTLTATATSVTFSSISQAYRDLVLVVNTANGPVVTLNGITTSIYNYVAMWGNGSTTGSYAETTTNFGGTWNGGSPVRQIYNIFDYSSTDKHKSILSRDDRSTAATNANAGRWANTAAITSITITATLVVGDSFTLYGIASA